MKAYVLIERRVSDAQVDAIDRELAAAAITRHGGRYLARGGRIEVLEGDWKAPECLLIVEFDSLEQAQRFYDSPEYQQARAARGAAAAVNMLAVEGLPL
ncbi:MAG TPA: DUF1330 domain-containing protein [Candidatus Accumulibacter phosphatis]|nr:MAG: hypothetical protein AW07_02012 [Candidatus Accumulibacter sp. SK-11]HAY28847.1 DUF1330 domain-containing protein [Accumulibacter sp.]HCV14543.1 DUF1330 domain-containing protein [Accumulibacter sp.]HRL76462.1 DUF1330 domain-containing protein [Candidatus Accumulibacter phosphatis]HRQ95840.1 DUF1330 domain-containing protein [Candidatus Accumulibacter phosphatis]